jgi:hypothetical protein
MLNLPFEAPTIFIGRDDLLDEIDSRLETLGNGGRVYWLTGPRRIGKSAVLDQIAELAEAYAYPALWYDLLTLHENPHKIWATIKAAVDDAGVESPVVLLVDNLHEEHSGFLLEELQFSFEDQPVLVVATLLEDLIAPPWSDLTPTPYPLTTVEPRDLAGLFGAETPMQIGYDLHELSGGVPEVVSVLVDFWIEEGWVRLDEEAQILVMQGDTALTDFWDTWLQPALDAALAKPDFSAIDEELLLDWLTCAATEGPVFSQAVLSAVMAHEFTPAQTAALLQHFAGGDYPILEPIEAVLPYTSSAWRFLPFGLREYLLLDADEADVAHYGEAIFTEQERLAGPRAETYGGQFRALARQSLTFLERNLIAQAEAGVFAPQSIPQQLQISEAMGQYLRYARKG